MGSCGICMFWHPLGVHIIISLAAPAFRLIPNLHFFSDMASSMNTMPIFVFMDRLPTASECASAIFSFGPSYGTQIQKNAIYEFSLGVAEL